MTEDFSRKIGLGFYGIIAVFAVLCLRLWQLQVLQGDMYLKLSENNRLRILRTPAPRGIIYDRNGVSLVKNIPTFNVSINPDSLKDIDLDGLCSLLGLDKREIEERLNRPDASPFVPIKLKMGVSFQDVAHVEAMRSDFPGLFVETDVGRAYPFEKAGAHVIGYLGKITPVQLTRQDLRSFPADAMIGQWGAEAMFDKDLRGKPGERIVEVDALGRELRLIQQKPPVKGDDITLSIDINIQKAVEDAFGGKAGALVAIKPGSGEILALESLPSFDPNIFSGGISHSNWKAIMEDRKKPMLNRAFQSRYPPGSIFKIVTAIAALEEGVMKPNEKVNCTGGIRYGKWFFGCWQKKGHGLVDFHRAIVESCDSYFYEMGRRLGIDRIYKYAVELGLGKKTGLEFTPVKEETGLIPNTEWKKKTKHQPWFLGDTFISAIGQGYVSATPIQMAAMTALVAADGRIYKPTLLKGDFNPVGEADLKQENLELVKSAMAGVVNEPNGTAKGASSALAVVAGKTGTAQVVGRQKGSGAEKFMDHAWFIAFAPEENPSIALAVFVEHGGGGGAVAAPIAKKAIEAYLKPARPSVRKTADEEDTDNAEN